MASAKALNFNDKSPLLCSKMPHPPRAVRYPAVPAQAGSPGKGHLLVREKRASGLIFWTSTWAAAPKITNSGAGGKLLLDPPSADGWSLRPAAAPGRDAPLTVKMRIGWDAEHLTGVEVAKRSAANGADPDRRAWLPGSRCTCHPLMPAAIAAIKQAIVHLGWPTATFTTAEGALTQ